MTVHIEGFTIGNRIELPAKTSANPRELTFHEMKRLGFFLGIPPDPIRGKPQQVPKNRPADKIFQVN